MEIKMVNVGYQSPKGELLLDSVDFSFQEGKITGIIGPTGSGKTTVLDLIRLVKLPTTGEITMGKYFINSKGMQGNINEYYSNIGYVSADPKSRFFFHQVAEEISFQLEKFRYPMEKRTQQLERTLDIVGLDSSYLYRDPLSLSSGEANLISLAINLSYNPKILLLDEPTIGLDSFHKQTLITLLMRIRTRYQKTILIAGHDVDFINRVADELLVLKDGKVLSSGPKVDVLKESQKLKECNISLPKITKFEDYVMENKKIRLGRRQEINDLVKDILRKS